jgi:DNA integrity scanning protein DisA with diadenylate cyclase activity
MIRFTVPTADTVGTTENGKLLLIKDYEKEKNVEMDPVSDSVHNMLSGYINRHT